MTNNEAEKSSGIDIIRRKLEEWSFLPYYFQSFNRGHPGDWPTFFRKESIDDLQRLFDKQCRRFQSFQFSIEPVTVGNVEPCSYSQLQEITDFSTDKFIQKTLSGRLFRGTIVEGCHKRPVIVKIWDFFLSGRYDYEARVSKFTGEIELFTDENANIHPNLVKLCRYCCETRLAAVYDGRFTSLLSDEIMSDEFGWDKRINVATQLADLFAWLHDKRIAFGSVTTSCIMIDEEKKNIKVFDFGFVSNHANEDSEISVTNLIGREAPEVSAPGKRTMKSDVYIFGLLLLALITKKESGLGSWVSMRSSLEIKAKSDKRHLVHESFTDADLQTALDITLLTLRCMSLYPDKRPTMKEVHNALTALRMSELSVEKRKRNESELLQEVCECT